MIRKLLGKTHTYKALSDIHFILSEIGRKIQESLQMNKK